MAEHATQAHGLQDVTPAIVEMVKCQRSISRLSPQAMAGSSKSPGRRVTNHADFDTARTRFVDLLSEQDAVL